MPMAVAFIPGRACAERSLTGARPLHSFLPQDNLLTELSINAIVTLLPAMPPMTKAVLKKNGLDEDLDYLLFPLEECSEVWRSCLLCSVPRMAPVADLHWRLVLVPEQKKCTRVTPPKEMYVGHIKESMGVALQQSVCGLHKKKCTRVTYKKKVYAGYIQKKVYVGFRKKKVLWVAHKKCTWVTCKKVYAGYIQKKVYVGFRKKKFCGSHIKNVRGLHVKKCTRVT